VNRPSMCRRDRLGVTCTPAEPVANFDPHSGSAILAPWR
jgi:hypothetical protein